MAKFCICFETMKLMKTRIASEMSIVQLIDLVAASEELRDIRLRTQERKELKALNVKQKKNSDEEIIRYRAASVTISVCPLLTGIISPCILALPAPQVSDEGRQWLHPQLGHEDQLVRPHLFLRNKASPPLICPLVPTLISLIQATLGSLKIESMSLNSEVQVWVDEGGGEAILRPSKSPTNRGKLQVIFRNGERVAKCLVEFLLTLPKGTVDFTTMLNAVRVHKCMQAKYVLSFALSFTLSSNFTTFELL
jgi:hypothetical protein